MTEYNTFSKMNKEIRFFGLTSMQFGSALIILFLIVIVLIFKSTDVFTIVLILSPIISLSGVGLGKLQKEHKTGNPSYIQGIFINMSTPKKIVDRKNIFNQTIRRKDIE